MATKTKADVRETMLYAARLRVRMPTADQLSHADAQLRLGVCRRPINGEMRSTFFMRPIAGLQLRVQSVIGSDSWYLHEVRASDATAYRQRSKHWLFEPVGLPVEHWLRSIDIFMRLQSLQDSSSRIVLSQNDAACLYALRHTRGIKHISGTRHLP